MLYEDEDDTVSRESLAPRPGRVWRDRWMSLSLIAPQGRAALFWYKLDSMYIQPMLLQLPGSEGTQTWTEVKDTMHAALFRRSDECMT